MRILNFQDGFTSNSVPTLGTISATGMLNFSTDAAFVTFKTIAAAAGDMYFNTTYSVPKFYDGTVWQFFSGEAVPYQKFTLANNQSTPADVTGMFLDETKYRSGKFGYTIYRNTTSAGATELEEQGVIDLDFKGVAGSCTISQTSDGPDDSGITFSVTALGQVQYTSTNITGTAGTSYIEFSGRMKPL